MAKKDKAKSPASTDTERTGKPGKGKGKKGKDAEIDAEPADDLLVSSVDLEVPEKEPDQYTETSYTSASFESLPPVPEEPKSKKKKKKKLDEEPSLTLRSSLQAWSSEDFLAEQAVVVEQVEEEQRKKKKGKKGKKKKDAEEEEQPPDFPKPKKWKSMSKKDRNDWLTMMIEEWRAEREAERQAYIAGAKDRRDAFARMQAEVTEKDAKEQVIRGDILAKTCRLFRSFEQQKMDSENQKQLRDEWKQYLRCDGLPDPRVVTQMNTYLQVWRTTKQCDADQLERRCKEVLPMLELLEEFVANRRRYTERQAENFNEIRVALRAQLSVAMECAMYTLLRDIERRLARESLRVATYGRAFEALRLHAWVAVRMPNRMKRENEPEPDPLELEFPALRMQLRMPRGVDGSMVCVRAARATIDLYSESARTFPLTVPMLDDQCDLYHFTCEEHVATYKLKNEQDAIRAKFYKDIKTRVKELEAFLEANKFLKNKAELEELDKLNVAEPAEMPDPRLFQGDSRVEAFTKYLAQCNYRTRTGEVNLRKYRVCGGVLNLDLLQQPPQPKPMRNEVEITTLSLPKQLEPVRYQVQYRAPPPPAPGVTRTPEEIEAEMRTVEAEYEKLARVHIELSTDVLWFEPPVVCQWQAGRNIWTSAYINDLKYNEDKCTVTFRTGVLWPIGISTLKYSNLPFQGWEVKPDPKSKDGVLISVSGLCVSCVWLCRGSRVQLVALQHATTQALQNHINKRYSVKQMIRIMREGSCDFFPEYDAHNQLEGTCPKEWCVERHQYHAMAFLSRAYNFQWSRWNNPAGPRNIVMQVREAVDKKRESSFQMMLTTPLQTTLIKCSELAQEYSDEPLLGMKFYPDLFTMNMQYGSSDARRAAFGMKFQLVETVFGMLRELKLCSYSS